MKNCSALAANKIVDRCAGNIKIVEKSGPMEEYGFAFHPDNIELKNTADKVIDTKRRRGEIRASSASTHPSI